MNSKNPVLRISVFVIALFAGLSVTLAQAGPTADVVTIISNLENDAVKADLADDPDFTRKFCLRTGPGAIAMEPISPKPCS
jgi:hypothetical protein